MYSSLEEKPTTPPSQRLFYRQPFPNPLPSGGTTWPETDTSLGILAEASGRRSAASSTRQPRLLLFANLFDSPVSADTQLNLFHPLVSRFSSPERQVMPSRLKLPT